MNILTRPEEMIEPFAFDVENARYLLQSSNVEYLASAQRMKHAFRKNPKSEVVSLHILREKLAIQGQLNPIVVHSDFYSLD